MYAFGEEEKERERKREGGIFYATGALSCHDCVFFRFNS